MTAHRKKEEMKVKRSIAFRGLSAASLGLIALMVVGCGRAPQERIDAAHSALEAAKQAEAETYVLEAYSEAEKRLAEAMEAVAAQKERPFFSRSYTEAVELLTQAEDLAQKAKTGAEHEREEWSRNAEALIEQAQTALVAARESAEKVRRAAKREALTGELEKAGALLFEGEKAFKAGDLKEAHSKAEEAKALADDVAEEAGSPATKG